MNKPEKSTTPIRRRQMLARLGLIAGAVYVSPLLLNVSQANAATRPTRYTRPTRPTRFTRPTRPTRFTRPTRPTRPSRPW